MYPIVRNRMRQAETPFDLISREFDRMLGRYFAEGEVPEALAPYPVDVHEDADHYYVEAELPGFTQDQIDLTLENGVLTIRAERSSPTKGDAAKGGSIQREPLHLERRWTQFQRSFTLPTQVNEAAVKAELADGVLRVTLDKREEVKPRKIQITAGDTGRHAVVTNGNK